MARPREFDEAAVLDAAITCFWERGYRATSVRDLAAEMGIAGPSLYNAFSNKRSLFRKALERYMQTSARARITDLESSLPPKLAVLAFLADVVKHSIDDGGRRGCFWSIPRSRSHRTIRKSAKRLLIGWEKSKRFTAAPS